MDSRIGVERGSVVCGESGFTAFGWVCDVVPVFLGTLDPPIVAWGAPLIFPGNWFSLRDPRILQALTGSLNALGHLGCLSTSAISSRLSSL